VKHFIFLFGLITLSFGLHGQNPILDNEPKNDFLKIIRLIEQEAFAEARKQLSLTKLTEREKELVTALIDLNAYDIMINLERFVRESDHDPLVNSALLNLGNAYFESARYKESVNYYQQINDGFFTKKVVSTFQFNHAYALMQIDSIETAVNQFTKVVELKGNEQFVANYYLGYLNYEQGNYETALLHFKNAEQDITLIEWTAPYTAKILLTQDQLRTLQNYVVEVEELVSQEVRADLLLLAGEAYFELEEFQKAVNSITKGIELYQRPIEPQLYYKLAYCYDQLDQIDESITYYELAGLDSTLLGQLSAFRLGEIFTLKGTHKKAINAFETAYHIGILPEISEQSLFLKGKNQLSDGQYQQGINTLSLYLNKYENGAWIEEAGRHIAKAYLNTTAYDQAISFLAPKVKGNEDYQQAYQKVTLLKAQQLMNQEQNGAEAAYYARESMSWPKDRSMYYEAEFLLAESLVLQGNERQAIPYYKEVIASGKLHEESLYGLGYAYFNTGDYENALVIFDELNQKRPSEEINTRLADCYYVQKRFDKARQLYNNSMVYSPDYATFQIGLCHYLQDEYQIADSVFNALIKRYPSSQFVPNSIFQSAKSNFESLNFRRSIVGYKQYIRAYPTSPLMPYASLEMAIAHTNLKEYLNAEQIYRQVLNQYPGHEIQDDAILGLQDLIAKGHEIVDYDDMISQLKSGSLSKKAILTLQYEQAKSR
jgi:tetratricopeptide (TPR) repeat protein